MDFNDFWALYPRKDAKIKAEKSWSRVPKKHHEAIEEDLKKRKWPADKTFIPLPTTYLNGKRWLDESTNVTKVTVEPRKVYRSQPRQGLTKTASQHLENLKKLYGIGTTEKG